MQKWSGLQPHQRPNVAKTLDTFGSNFSVCNQHTWTAAVMLGLIPCFGTTKRQSSFKEQQRTSVGPNVVEKHLRFRSGKDKCNAVAMLGQFL